MGRSCGLIDVIIFLMLKIRQKKTKATKKTVKKSNKKLIIANWKMNPDNSRDAKKIFGDLKKKNLKIKNSTAVICPPVIFLEEISRNYRGRQFVFGAQDVSWNKNTESTGETSIEMLKNSNVKYVIVGHAERRAAGETDETASLKIERILNESITPVLCIGEVERDVEGKYFRFLERELHESLSRVSKKDISKIVIAYEPVWAIGKGKTAMTGHELHQMNIFIKKILASIYDKKTAMQVPILYGGSVDVDNCKEILDEGEVDGLLVGHASLNPHVFADILKKIG